jgi:DNA-binding FadR family transcriptional regulator
VLLADEIERQIRNGSFMPGAVFASEQDLQSRSAAGRSVVRQAVRLLAQRGVAYMRRGVGGGLIVQAPDVEVVARNLSIAMEREVQGFPELGGLYKASEAYLFSHVLPGVDAHRGDQLRALARDLNALSAEEFARTHGHRRMAIAFYKAFDDAAGTLVVRAAMECGMDFIPHELGEPEERLRDEFWQLTLQSVEALIAGDVGRLYAIRSAQMRFFASSPQWRDMERAPRPNRHLMHEEPEGLKAERLSREILREVRLRNWSAGTRLGSCREVALRYGCTPAVLREAIRILEENSAVQMVHGRHGGLVVGAPDRHKAVMRAVGFLKAAAYLPRNAWQFLDQILLVAIERGAGHVGPQQLRAVHNCLESWSSPAGPSREAIRQFYIELAGVAGTAALQMIAEILARRACPDEDPAAPASRADAAGLEVLMQHVAAGDAGRARRAYLTHAQQRSATQQ